MRTRYLVETTIATTTRFIDAIKIIRYIVAVGAIGLLAVTLLIAEPTNGALSWVNIGGVSLQPSELVKVAFISCALRFRGNRNSRQSNIDNSLLTMVLATSFLDCKG